MVTKKDLIIAVLCTFCLTVTLFMVAPTRSTSTMNGLQYDAWKDINDDGKLDILDIVQISSQYGATGTPINKTALLWELQTEMNNLNASILQLQSKITGLETSLASMNASIDNLKNRIDNVAYTYNSSWADNGVWIYSYSRNEWHQIPEMSVSINLSRTSFVRITFSSDLGKPSYGGMIRILVDSNIAYPGLITLKNTDSMYFSMDFYLPNVSPGVHLVEAQCCTEQPYPQDGIIVYRRIILATAYPNP
jgi:hypothetical protein